MDPENNYKKYRVSADPLEPLVITMTIRRLRFKDKLIAFLLVIHYDIRNLMTKKDFDCADPLLSHPEDELIADIMAFHEVINFQTVFSLAKFINF